jgi:hypothetical protein
VEVNDCWGLLQAGAVKNAMSVVLLCLMLSPSEKKKSGLIAQAGWTYVFYVRSGGTLRLPGCVLSISRTSFTRFAG